MAAGSFGTHALLPCSREFRQAIPVLPNIKDCAVSICCSDLERSCHPTHCYLIKQARWLSCPPGPTFSRSPCCMCCYHPSLVVSGWLRLGLHYGRWFAAGQHLANASSRGERETVMPCWASICMGRSSASAEGIFAGLDALF
jgi:hypothetical protein